MNKKWFALSIDQVEEKLRTNAAAGLSRKAARSRCNKANGSIYIAEATAIISNIAKLKSDTISASIRQTLFLSAI